MIYTSYFAKARNLSPQQYCFVSVAVGTPKWFPYTVQTINKKYLPDWQLISDYKFGVTTAEEYTKVYMEKLSRHDPRMLLTQLQSLEKLGDVLLLCHESSGFCHRHLLAQWLNAGIEELK